MPENKGGDGINFASSRVLMQLNCVPKLVQDYRKAEHIDHDVKAITCDYNYGMGELECE